MPVKPIVIVGDPILHQETHPVAEPVTEIAPLIQDLFDTLDASHGVGLAANQIGVGLRVFVYDCPDVDGPDGTMLDSLTIAHNGGEKRRGCVINPQLETTVVPQTTPHADSDSWEGCLSVPGESFPCNRADWTQVTGLDQYGHAIKVSGYGFFARCLQHEVGHLDGFLYTDKLDGSWVRKAKKAIRKHGWTTPGLTWMPGVDPDPFA